MVRTAFIYGVVFALLGMTNVYGQKVKYKDIWALLNTRQFDAAEPLLRRYLKDNDDNPNAHLYMGMIYQEKVAKEDVLKDTRRAMFLADSAVYYYDRAYKSITEKELKRNDEYYQAYNRRDLRTGEFGVKLSDVQFDLEKRMAALRERNDKVKMTRYYFTLWDSLYRKSNTLFVSIQKAYPSRKEFYLRADDALLKQLTTLGVRFDSCAKAQENYKSSLTALGKTAYSTQVITLESITDFKKDGLTLGNAYDAEVKLWNYGRFASESKEAIAKDIFPSRKRLVDYDVEINTLRDKFSKDSLLVSGDVERLRAKVADEPLARYDAAPLPQDVFSLKLSELVYRGMLRQHRMLRDSGNVHLQLRLLRDEMQVLHKLDSAVARLTGSDLDGRTADYASFVTDTYNTPMVLKSYINTMQRYAADERRVREGLLARRQESLRWLVSGTSAMDSIPLFNDAARSTKFKPLVIVDEKYTSGIQYIDSVNMNGYFCSIPASRKPDVRVSFPVDKSSFKLSRLPKARSLVFSDASNQIYFVLLYSEVESKDKTYVASLAKIYRSDGLAWSNTYTLPFVPKEMSFRADTGELIVKADAIQRTIDKNGKMK